MVSWNIRNILNITQKTEENEKFKSKTLEGKSLKNKDKFVICLQILISKQMRFEFGLKSW